MALWIDASVTTSRIVTPRAAMSSTARALRRAISSQIGWPDGASAECGNASPRASATTWALAAVPRKWHPPPGDAHTRHPSTLASSSDNSPRANRAPIDWILPVSSPSVLGSVTPPGTSTLGRPPKLTRAIIMAGKPLSHAATPRIPRAVGIERT